MSFAELKQVDGAAGVVLDELSGPGVPVDSREHARIRGSVNDPIHSGQRLEIGRVADVCVNKANAQFIKHTAVPLAAGANQIIETDNLKIDDLLAQPARENLSH